MANPVRYDPNDPHLLRLREACLALPAAQEKVSHGQPAFFTKKTFALFGGVPKGDHHSDIYARSVLVLPDADEREALLQSERFFHPAYYGPSGWVGYNFQTDEVDWDEVAELLDSSYRNTATKTLIKQLDER